MTDEPNFGELPEGGEGLGSRESAGMELPEVGSEQQDASLELPVLSADKHSKPGGLAAQAKTRAGRHLRKRVKGESRQERKAREWRDLERRVKETPRSDAEAIKLIDELGRTAHCRRRRS